MVARLKNVAPIQFALVSAVVYGVLGLVVAVLLVPFSMLITATAPPEQVPKWFGIFFGVAGLVMIPVMEAVTGFVFALIAALIYNLVSGWTGGIEITLATVETPSGTTYTATT